MLKRRYGEPSPTQALLHELAYDRSIGLSPASSSSAESPCAPVDQLPAPPASANASDSQQPTDGSNIVEPEPRDEGAKLTSDVTKEVPGTPAVRPSAHEAHTPVTAQPAAQPTSEELSETLNQMLRAMFLGGSGAPRRSGMPPVADRPQLWLLVAVKKAANIFWQAHEQEARSCCQPSLLSETEIRGYLANDALGNPLLPPGYGIHCPDAVGKRVHNGVAKAEKEERVARKTARDAARAAARKGGIADPDAADKAAQAALAASYDLQLPGGARHHQQKTAAIMSPHELSMAGPETKLSQLVKDQHEGLKLYEEAEWRLQGAEAANDAAERRRAQCERRKQELKSNDAACTSAAYRRVETQVEVAWQDIDAREKDERDAQKAVRAAKATALQASLRLCEHAMQSGLEVKAVRSRSGCLTACVDGTPSTDTNGHAGEDDDADGHFHIGHRHPCSGCRKSRLTHYKARSDGRLTRYKARDDEAGCEKKCMCEDGICHAFPMAWDHRRRVWCRATAPLQDGVFVVSIE